MRGLRFLTIAGAAFTGLLGAHALDYQILASNELVRTRLLVSSGHVWLGRAPKFAVVALGIAAIAAFATGFADHRRTRRCRTWLLLSLVQGGAFVALEAGERLAANAGSSRVLQATTIGVALQFITAAVAAMLIQLLHSAGAAVARSLRGARAVERLVRVRATVWRASRALAHYSGSLSLGRAPPVLAR